MSFPLKDIGTEVTGSKQRDVEDMICAMTSWERTIGFPGTLPIPLNKANLWKDVKKKKYFVSEKSDGYRFFILILHSDTFLVDPNFRVQKINLHFPNRANLQTSQHQTLIDGELIEDHFDDKNQLRFLVYDLICFNGKNVMKYPLTERLKILQNDLIWPRKNDSTGYDYSKESFSVRLKDFFETRNVRYVLEELIPCLPHGNEGLVFTPLDLPYKTGVNVHLLKWKPAHLNSADFQLGIEWK